MNLGKQFQQRVREMVQNPVFDKPIQVKNFEKRGTIILVTRIKPKPRYENIN